MPPIPKFFIHSIGCKVFEQDMGLLSSQNELLVKANQGVKDLYLPLKSSDGWVVEYRKWLDKVRIQLDAFGCFPDISAQSSVTGSQGFVRKTFSPPPAPAVVDRVRSFLLMFTLYTYPNRSSYVSTAGEPGMPCFTGSSTFSSPLSAGPFRSCLTLSFTLTLL